MNLTSRSRTRWLVPIGAVVTVAAAAVSTNLTGAFADAKPQPRTPAQLIADINAAKATGISGTVTHTANLGLPDLSALTAGTSGAAQLSGIATGTHTWRLWYAGPEKMRLALLGRGGESDIIRNGNTTWIWSSASKSATKVTRPPGTPRSGKEPTDLASSIAEMTPQQIAEQVLAKASATSTITSGAKGTVAGRPTYELRVTPKGTNTLVKAVTIDVDAERRVPLRVRAYSTKIKAPAFEIGFTSVNFAQPSAKQFTFNPPPGTKVTERNVTPPSASSLGTDTETMRPLTPLVTTFGTGWSAVQIISPEGLADLLNGTSSDSAPKGGADPSNPLPALISLINRMPQVSGKWGTGHVFEGTLFSVIVTDSGRVAVGPVPVKQLLAALNAPQAR